MTGEVLATLPDGSVATCEPFDWCGSIVSRWVDGVCVWGQAFSRTDDHDGQVAEVLAKMNASPASFVRWWNAPAIPAGQLTLEVDAA